MTCSKESYAADTDSQGPRSGGRHMARLLAELRQEKPPCVGRDSRQISGQPLISSHLSCLLWPAVHSCQLAGGRGQGGVVGGGGRMGVGTRVAL